MRSKTIYARRGKKSSLGWGLTDVVAFSGTLGGVRSVWRAPFRVCSRGLARVAGLKLKPGVTYKVTIEARPVE